MDQGKRSSSPSPDDGDSYYVSYDLDSYCEYNSYGTLAVCNASVSILGLISGVLLIVIILKNYTLRGDKYILLNNFLLASVLLLIISGFTNVEKALNPCWDTGNFVCKLIRFSKTVFTNASTFFLVTLAIQQLNRYRQKFVTVFNSTHSRRMIVVGTVWGAAVILSIPEILMAEVLWYSTGLSMCIVNYSHIRQRFSFSAKVLFFEYITPLLILLVVNVITSIYVVVVKSRYSQWGVTTGASLVPRDDKHPKHFALVVTLSVIYLIGHFPLYSFELVTLLKAIWKDNNLRLFWWHMDNISIFFSLLPPALTPICIMLLSWQHLGILKWIYGHFTVVELETQADEENSNANIEQGTKEEQ